MKKVNLLFLVPAILLTGCTVETPFFLKTVVEGVQPLGETEFTDLVGETLTVKDIDCASSVMAEVNLHYSETERKIVLNAQSDIAEHIVIKSENKEIKIYGKANEEYKTEKITIDIYVYTFSTLNLAITKAAVDTKTLSKDKFELNVSAASNVSLTTAYELNEGVKGIINTSGASKVNISNIKADELEYNISGASDVYVGQDNSNKVTANLSGVSKLTHGSNSALQLEKTTLKITGTSQYYSFYRYVKDVEMNLSGLSSAKARVLEKLTVSASGGSTCYYLTDNEDLVINKNLSGGSKLQSV